MKKWCVVVVSLFSMVFGGAAMAKDWQAGAAHNVLAEAKDWLNVERPLTQDDLKGRVILLDFWTYCCINCLQVIPDLHYLEEKYGNKLLVIGVHSAKFANEKETDNIRAAIGRHNIYHPVINDSDFEVWNQFGVRAWPSFVVLGPDGNVVMGASGEGNRDRLDAAIGRLVERYEGQLNMSPLPLQQEPIPAMTHGKQLQYPGKFTYADDFMGAPALIISDTGNHRVLAARLDGEVVWSIGQEGVAGYVDGAAGDVLFNQPQGVLYKDGIIYVAEIGNHTLRAINVAEKRSVTLAGTGEQGHVREGEGLKAKSTPLASPWDLAFYPNDRHIAIAMAGTHQLWSYSLSKKTLSVLAGNGRESIDDGRYPLNSLSQPSGLAAVGEELFFVDSETSSLRVLKNNSIKTLIGTGLFDFGYEEGFYPKALMQHPIGVAANEKYVWVADSFNHAVRIYDRTTGKLLNFAGNGTSGKAVDESVALSSARFAEPADIELIDNQLYVLDTNNHVIRVIDPEAQKVKTLHVFEMPSSQTLAVDVNLQAEKKESKISVEVENEEFRVDVLQESLPNLDKFPTQYVDLSETVTVHLDLEKGWKINDLAHSWLGVFDPEFGVGHYFVDMQNYADKSVHLPEIMGFSEVMLQGTFFYCPKDDAGNCLIRSIEIPLSQAEEGQIANNNIHIDLKP